MLVSVIGGLKKSLTTLLMNARFRIIHMIGIDCYSKIYMFTYVDECIYNEIVMYSLYLCH